LWTHFVTPRGFLPQYDQTKQVAYYKKERVRKHDLRTSLMLGVAKVETLRDLVFQFKYAFAFFFEGLAGSFCTESTAQFCLEMC
jgi:hypothetical protein